MVAVEDVNEQLVLIERPIEIELVEDAIGLDRCILQSAVSILQK